MWNGHSADGNTYRCIVNGGVRQCNTAHHCEGVPHDLRMALRDTMVGTIECITSGRAGHREVGIYEERNGGSIRHGRVFLPEGTTNNVIHIWVLPGVRILGK